MPVVVVRAAGKPDWSASGGECVCGTLMAVERETHTHKLGFALRNVTLGVNWLEDSVCAVPCDNLNRVSLVFFITNPPVAVAIHYHTVWCGGRWRDT